MFSYYLKINIVVLVLQVPRKVRTTFGMIVFQVWDEKIETIDAAVGRIQEISIGWKFRKRNVGKAREQFLGFRFCFEISTT